MNQNGSQSLAPCMDAAERERLMTIVVERMSNAVRRNPDQWFVFQPNWIASDIA